MNLYDAISGRWCLTRAVMDRRDGQHARFSGHATLEGAAPTLNYHETGVLSIGDTEIAAERRYRWTCLSNEAQLYFEDGRFFHAIVVVDGRASADHLCGDDHYHVDYAFQDANSWTATYEVAGPRKDYTMRSDYCRIA